MDLIFNKKISNFHRLKKLFCLILVITLFLNLQLCSCHRRRKTRSQGSGGSVLSLYPTTFSQGIVIDRSQIQGHNNYDTLSSEAFNQYGGGDSSKRVKNKIRQLRATKDEIDYEEEEEDDYDEEKLRLEQMETESRRIRQAGGNSAIHDVKLPEDYSVFEIPKDPKGNPMPLYVYVNIINILDWDELNEMLHIDLEFSVMWTDFKMMYFNNKSNLHNELPTIENLTKEEIRAKRITLNNPFILDKVWKPNLFIENLLSIKQPTLMARPVTVRFIPEVGWFEYITRITVKMDCEMDFHKYPADTQECEFSIRGFSYPKKDLNLNWYQNGAFLNDLTLPSFDVAIQSTNKQDLRLHKKDDDDPDDVFEVLSFVIAARRNLSYHFVQTYLASTFYIVITTLCFLLPARMIEARIGISMTTLLTLTAMFASVRESTPIVSYVKAIDIWMVGCIFFVFLVLAQFTIHTWITGGKVDEEKSPSSRKSSVKFDQTKELLAKDESEMIEFSPNEDTGGESRKSGYSPQVIIPNTSTRLEHLANVTERYSFPIFLAIFGIYTFIYWTWLLVTADYFNWVVNSTLNDLVDFSDD